MTKKIYESKEVWVAVVALINYGLSLLGFAIIEPTPELYAAIVGVVLAIRVLFTEARITFK